MARGPPLLKPSAFFVLGSLSQASHLGIEVWKGDERQQVTEVLKEERPQATEVLEEEERQQATLYLGRQQKRCLRTMGGWPGN